MLEKHKGQQQRHGDHPEKKAVSSASPELLARGRTNGAAQTAQVLAAGCVTRYSEG